MALYGVLYAASVVVAPSETNLDMTACKRTVYYTPNRLLAAGLASLGSTNKPKLIFLGASNVQAGFRPADFCNSLPHYEIDNLALGNQNLSRIRVELGVIQQLLPTPVLKKSLIIVGIWYGAFTENAPALQRPLLDVERVLSESGLFVRNDRETLCPVVPSTWMPVLVALLRPYYFVEYVVEKAQRKDRDFGMVYHQHDPADEDVKVKTMDYLDKWVGRPDDRLGEEQFQELLKMRDMVDRSGGTLVIVDLPLPRWHTDRSRYVADYHKKRHCYMPQVLRSAHIRYVNLGDEAHLCRSELFFDGTHPNPSGAHLWCDALKSRLSDRSLSSRVGYGLHLGEN